MKQNTQSRKYITIRIHDSQNQTEAHKIYSHIYNDKKWNQKNVKECDKRKSHISSKLHMIYISSNVRHPVTKTFTPLHYTSPNYTSLYFTTLVDTSLPPI